MKKTLTHLALLVLAAAFLACSGSKKTDTNNENSSYSHSTISKNDISEKCWCFSSYIFYLKNDQTCSVKRIEDESINWAADGRWVLAHDTLLIIQQGEKKILDSALYKITLTNNKLAVRLVKELKDHYHRNYLMPYYDKDFNNNPMGDETIFLLDEEHSSLEEKYINGSWHGEGRVNTFEFNPDGICLASGEASQRFAAKTRKGKWKLQSNQILIVWNELYQPTVREDEDGEKYSRDGEYDSLKITEYDTLHVIRSTSFRLFTKEYGLFLGGANKDFLKSLGY